jgi:hypothetical protein
VHKGDTAGCAITCRDEVHEVFIRALVPKEVSPQFTPFSGSDTRPNHSVAPTDLCIGVAARQCRGELLASGEGDFDAVTVVCALPIVFSPSCTMRDFYAAARRIACRNEVDNVLGRISVVELLSPLATPVIHDCVREFRWGWCWGRYTLIRPYNSITPTNLFVHNLIVKEDDQISGETGPAVKCDGEGVVIKGASAIIP